MKAFKFNSSLILSIFFCSISVYANINNQNVATLPIQNQWVKCLLTIAKHHFIDGSSIAIVSANQLNAGLELKIGGDIVQRMMRESRWSILIKTTEGPNSMREKVEMFEIYFKY